MTNQTLKEIILLGVHAIAPVSREPVTVMTVWTLVQIHWQDGTRSRHLVGRANSEGRVCSAIQRFDLQAMTAQTRSGRLYQLQGAPGKNRDGFYVFEVWLRGQQPNRVRDLSAALMRLRRRRGLVDE